MNKIFITVVLFLLALTVIAATDLMPLLEDQTYHIAFNIPEVRPHRINDFSHSFASDAVYDGPLYNSPESFATYYGTLWYSQDFAEDPFNGKIDILVMGEPLPTPFTTLLVAFCTVGIIYMCKQNRGSVV